METLVGRAPAVAALRAAVDGALRGQGRLALLAGEPGIGKTSLATATAAYAEERGAVVAWGTGWDGDGVPGFWPWIQVLRSLGRVGAFDVDPGPADNRFGLFFAVAEALAEVARRQPLVIVLDDLHWADPGSLRLLEFVVRHSRRERLLVLGTYRDVEPSPAPGLRDLLAGLAGLAETHDLVGLSVPEVARLLATLGVAADPAALHHRTGGNPFLVRETAHDTVPAAVGEAVSRRLATLPAGTLERLRTAALLGAEFDARVLAKAAPGEDLEAAVRGRVIRVAGEHTYRFEHDLYREALAAQLSPECRRHLHATIALALEQRPGATNAELAFHYGQALPDADRNRTLEVTVAAARDATHALAYEEATRLWRAAVRLEPSAASLVELADAARLSGDHQEARSAYRRAAGANEPGVLARAALGLHQLGTGVDEPHHEVIELLEKAPPEPMVLAALARELCDGPAQDPDRARELAARAVAAATDHSGQTLAFCLFARHDVVWGPGTARERLELADRMVAAAGPGPGELAFQGRFCRFIAQVDLGDPAAAVTLRDLDRLARESRLPRHRYLVDSRRSMMDILHGDDDEALAGMEATLALGELIGEPDRYGVYLTQLLVLGLAREGMAAVPRLELEFPAVAPPEFEPEMRAMAAVAAGDPEAGAAILRASVPADQRAWFRWRALGALALDSEVAVAAAADDLCRSCYAALSPYADEVIAIGGASAVLGPVSFYLGLLAQAMGEPERALAHLADALATAARVGARPMVARIREKLATVPGRPSPTEMAGFRRDGPVWTLTYRNRTVRLPDAKGLRDLAVLLAAPGREVPAVTLLAGTEGSAPGGSDPVLDETARAAYRARLAALDQRLDDAGAVGDRSRLAQLTAERDALVAELTHAAGLGGRARRLGDPIERARTTVTARIRDTLRRIEQHHPALGEHLRRSVTTGRSCAYRPAEPLTWRL